MGDDLEKTTKELLQGVKGPQAKAITVMAMTIDKKLDAILDAIAENQAKTDKRIDAMKQENDERFSKLRVIMFFSEHKYILIIICILLASYLGISDFESKTSSHNIGKATEIVKYIK
jgi:hypothetical protein